MILSQLRRCTPALRSAARGVFIQVEKTPNPYSLKFIPSEPVLPDSQAQAGSSGFHFHKGDKEYLRSPLAKKLLAIDHVTGIFIGKDFITVSKIPDGAWATIKPHVFSYVMDWYAEGDLAVEDTPRVNDTTILETDSEVVAMIKELIEARIRPAVQEDGGDIFFRGFDEHTGTVSVELAGSCVGCPSSSVTLRNGVENMLMHYIPEVKAIFNIEPDVDSDEFKLSYPPNTTSSDDTAEDDAPAKKKDHPAMSA